MTRTARLWLAVGLPGLALAGAAAALTLTSDHEDQPEAIATVALLIVCSFLVSGLVAWTRRPDNGTGRLLTAVAFAFALSGFWEADNRWLYSVGTTLGSLFFAVFLHLLLAFPRGSLETRPERRIVGALYGIALLVGVLPTLFDSSPNDDCSNCPPNPLLVVDSDAAANALQTLFSVLGVVIFLAVGVVIVRRWRSSTPAARRALSPVYLSGGATVILLGIAFGVDLASSRAGEIFFVLPFAAFATVPLFFLAGLLRIRLARTAAARLLLDVPDEPTPEQAEAGLRRALRDPSLQLLTWDDVRRWYRDTAGIRAEVEPHGRATTRIEYEGRPLAAVVHDVALLEEPELLREVLAVARLGLEKDRGLLALRRSEATTRALLDAMPDLMIRSARDGTYLDVQGNPDYLVRSPDELIGRTIWDILPLELAEPLMACVERTLDTGSVQTIEYQLEVDGALRDFEARMVVSGEDEVLAIVRDFTERRRLEEELQARLAEIEREQEFTRTVVNLAPIVFLLVDAEGRIVRFNDTCERLFGHLDDEGVRGQRFWDVFVAGDGRESAKRMLAQLAAGEPTVEQELHWLSSDGEVRVLVTSATSLLDGQGRFRFLICGLDVTERKRHLEELQRQHDFLSTVGKATPSLLFVVEADGTVAEEGVNRAFARATGYDDDEAVGRLFWELVVPREHRGATRRAFEDAVRGGETVEHETPWLRRNGGERLLVEWSCRPLGGVGEGGKYLVCGLDVTERKRQEEELRRSRARIVEAGDGERRRLERNLHDGAQQRLVSLSLALRLVQAKLTSDPGGAGDILRRASDELALALEELRELARGIHPAVLTDRGLAAALETLADRAPLPVELATVPEQRLPGSVEAAAFYVVSESLANVAKYAQASTARVSVTADNGYAVVEVADDGVGGADPMLGSGLRGLHDRVEALDGRLEVESLAGKGTLVRAVIPLEAAVVG